METEHAITSEGQQVQFVVATEDEDGNEGSQTIVLGKIFLLSDKIIGILFPKLFWPNLWEEIVLMIEKKNFEFQAEGREFAKFLRSLKQFIQAVKGQNNFWFFNLFLEVSQI